MQNKYQGGVRREKWHKKLFTKKHRVAGLVQWTSDFTKLRPSQRFQTSPEGDSSSCVDQGQASHAELWIGRPMSAKSLFQARKPKGYGDSLSGSDNNALVVGTTDESILPSEKMTDQELDQPYSVPTPIKAKGKGVFVPLDSNSIMDAINQWKGVKVTFISCPQEWDAPNQTPVYKDIKLTDAFGNLINGAFEHQIFFFDGKNNGTITFKANDSDGLWSAGDGLRYITEDFLLKRGTGASYVPGWIDTSIPVPSSIIPDPFNEFPNMTPEPSMWWKLFHFFLGR